MGAILNRRRHSERLGLQLGWIAATISLACIFDSTAAKAQSCRPADQLRPVLTPRGATQVPRDACVGPLGGPDAIPFAYFDDYSWRAFIALVWHVKIAQDGLPERGSPDPNALLERIGEQQEGGSPVTVFESLKADWETFQRPPGPSPWDQYDDAGKLLCPTAKRGDFILTEITKHGDVRRFVGIHPLREESVLVSQNRKFVWYLAAFNKREFNTIRDNGWFLFNKVEDDSGRILFDAGSLSVKSSWIEMTDEIPHRERFHTRAAWRVDPFTKACTPMKVGLVGLHIVQKTLTRQQWIWSTFEHVDNVPPPGYVPPAPGQKPDRTFTFNNGTSEDMPRILPDSYLFGEVKEKGAPPDPVNILRLKPIDSTIDDTVPFRSTTETNFMWQRALRDQNSVWQYYQLVVTQWPSNAGGVGGMAGQDPGTPGFTVPGLKFASSAFDNTTLETWPQTDINSACMNCHAETQTQTSPPRGTDFVWSLITKSYQPMDQGLKSPAGRNLQKSFRGP